MKFFFFHLMPYAAIDLDFTKKHKTMWGILPNSYYDPKIGHQLYNRYLDELEYADELGFDGLGVNEHHQSAYGLMPVPGVMAGALARRTKNAKIAIIGRALPLLSNPLTVAEEFAMIDNITGGRLIAGFVRGIGVEYHVSGVNPAFSHERYLEAHDLILRAWTETGPFEFEGKHYHFQYVNTWPRPFQQPHPPVWIPSQGSRETIEWAAARERKYTYLQTFAPAANVAGFMQMYRDCAEKSGYTSTPDQLGWFVPTYVAETDEIARREARPHIEAFLTKFLGLPHELLLPPGYNSLASLKRVAAAKKGNVDGRARTLEDAISTGLFLCGSPDTVVSQLQSWQEEIKFGNYLAGLQFGTLPQELTRKNMEIFAKEVMPRMRG